MKRLGAWLLLLSVLAPPATAQRDAQLEDRLAGLEARVLRLEGYVATVESTGRPETMLSPAASLLDPAEGAVQLDPMTEWRRQQFLLEEAARLDSPAAALDPRVPGCGVPGVPPGFFRRSIPELRWTGPYAEMGFVNDKALANACEVDFWSTGGAGAYTCRPTQPEWDWSAVGGLGNRRSQFFERFWHQQEPGGTAGNPLTLVNSMSENMLKGFRRSVEAGGGRWSLGLIEYRNPIWGWRSWVDNKTDPRREVNQVAGGSGGGGGGGTGQACPRGWLDCSHVDPVELGRASTVPDFQALAGVGCFVPGSFGAAGLKTVSCSRPPPPPPACRNPVEAVESGQVQRTGKVVVTLSPATPWSVSGRLCSLDLAGLPDQKIELVRFTGASGLLARDDLDQHQRLETRSTITGPSGSFQFSTLPPGTYWIDAGATPAVIDLTVTESPPPPPPPPTTCDDLWRAVSALCPR